MGSSVDTIWVKTPLSSYPVLTGEGILSGIGDQLKKVDLDKRAFVLCDQSVSSVGKQVEQALKASGRDPIVVEMNFSEEKKSFETVFSLYDALLTHGIGRKCALFAVGGGVTGDVAGFAASTMLRGLPLYQIPTTLLAQVDASIGGKTAVNYRGIKNIVGAFYQPSGVWVDLQVLKTLPLRHFLSGMAEIIKAAVIKDIRLFDLLERNLESWRKSSLPAGLLLEIVRSSIKIKADIVSQDPLEAGQRAFLNFGHTLAHALELHGKDLTHGEAVAIGMRFATRLSQAKGLCGSEVAGRVQALLEGIPVHVRYEDFPFERIWESMLHDKKQRNQEVKMVLLKNLGHVELFEVSRDEIEKTYNDPQGWWRKI